MPRGEPNPRILIVDDHLEMAEMLSDGLTDQGFHATSVGSGRQALKLLEQDPFDAVVTDLRMGNVDGMEVLETSRRLDSGRPVIVMTAYGAVDTAIESIRRGAYHYLTKPFKLEELVIFVRRALEEVRVRREAANLRKTLRDRFAPDGLLGRSKAMRRVFEMIERIAKTNAPVLITGETGTGKGLVAHVLHAQSERPAASFVTINCAALPEQLLESELFGHMKGAFTGATESRAGLFAEADGGTLFLDEIGEMAISLQAKLLHVLERGTVRPVGGTKEREVDVRIIAASNRDLRDRVQAGAFREDLLYRLDVIAMELPPLRARPEDIPDLIDQMLPRAKARYPQSPVLRLSAKATERLLDYHWPGNVRELMHVLERIVLLGRSEEIDVLELPPAVLEQPKRNSVPFQGEIIPVRELQRNYAAWALAQLGGNRSRTAEKLGVDFKTLAKWLSDDNKNEPRD